jgi:quercetin dioxygenase-like cupin family protein
VSVVHRFNGSETNFAWENVPLVVYEAEDARGTTKRVMIGPSEAAPTFHMRYFNIEPGGNTRLDQHDYEHGILILHGRAKVLLGEESVEVGPNDVIFVTGNDVHRFEALGDEPLGVLCVVPSER